MPSTTFAVPVARALPRPQVFEAELHDLALIGLHVPLAFLLRAYPPLVEVHSLAVLALGLMWSVSPRLRHRTVLAAAYCAGADVLWRMCGGGVFYEYAKYAIVLLLVAYVAHRGTAGVSRLPLLYFALLVPSIPLTIEAVGLIEARQEISFNLSGPLALAVAAAVFQRVDPATLPLRRLLVLLAAPTVGIAALAGRSTLSAEEIHFSTGSNIVTSGGFGPNQVSAMLGLGAVLLIITALHTATAIWRWVFLAVAMLLLTQALLTFSRGGVINALVCVGILGVHSLGNRRTRIGFALAFVLAGILAIEVVLPALDRFTGGALAARYTDVDPDVRGRLAEKELEIWRDHPVLGVGPGMAKHHRESLFRKQIAAHTEYTRLVAEHGFFGAIALAILLVLAVRAYLRAPTTLAKAWVGVFVGWPLLEMLHAAMRIGVISFTFALALLPWTEIAAEARLRRAR